MRDRLIFQNRPDIFGRRKSGDSGRSALNRDGSQRARILRQSSALVTMQNIVNSPNSHGSRIANLSSSNLPLLACKACSTRMPCRRVSPEQHDGPEFLAGLQSGKMRGHRGTHLGAIGDFVKIVHGGNLMIRAQPARPLGKWYQNPTGCQGEDRSRRDVSPCP